MWWCCTAAFTRTACNKACLPVPGSTDRSPCLQRWRQLVQGGADGNIQLFLQTGALTDMQPSAVTVGSPRLNVPAGFM